MTDNVRIDGKYLTRNNFHANLGISLLSYIFDMTPLAIHMKSKATAFVCVLTATFLTKIISSVLESEINFKVRLDVFSIHSDYYKIFLCREG